MNYILKRLCALIVILGMIPPAILGGEVMEVSRILCNGKQDPSGIDCRRISFSWVMRSPGRNQSQTAYEMSIGRRIRDLLEGRSLTWSSGKVPGSGSVLVPYRGPELESGSVYYWRVRVWDQDGRPSAWSSPGNFITGLPRDMDWENAAWIGFEELPDSLRLVPGKHGNGDNLGPVAVRRPVVPLFRKSFRVDKKVEHALIYVCGLGQYELFLNGRRVGDDFLSPGWTNYDRTCLYDTYDVTDQLRGGENALGVIVGNGFFNINREQYRKLVIAYGMPKLICMMKIGFGDGSSQHVITNSTWMTAPSPITYASIYGGESYDARLEQPGWASPGFDDGSWIPALYVRPPKGKLLPESAHPLKIIERIGSARILTPGKGASVYDFGQNASGIVELKVKGARGQQIVLAPGELLGKDSLVNQDASGKPYRWVYTLKGDSVETWNPRFTYYGFRYVQVEHALPAEAPAGEDLPRILGLELLHTRNSAPECGSFHCSDDLFTRTFSLIRWAIRSNLASVLTDCPHREKLGWLEQTHLMGGAIHYNYDISLLYRKMVRDMIDSQLENGLVPDIAPEFVPFEGGFRDSPEWGSAAVIMPYFLHLWYGDREILEEAYPMMKRYVGYLGLKAQGYILSHGLGDWYDLGPGFPGEAQLTPVALTATAFYYYDAKLLAAAARILNDTAGNRVYERLSEQVRSAFNRKFFDERTKVYSTGSQTAYAIALSMGIVEERERDSVVENLAASIRANGNALTSGDVGFHFLIDALARYAPGIIVDMNSREDVPGYGYQLRMGATALTESWKALPEVSNNHLMLGHIMEWFYGGLAGIRQAEDSKAYEKIIIAPSPVGNISWAKAQFISPHGPITSDWKILGHTFRLIVDIPVNTRAEIRLPVTGGAEAVREKTVLISRVRGLRVKNQTGSQVTIETGSGHYEFEGERK